MHLPDLITRNGAGGIVKITPSDSAGMRLMTVSGDDGGDVVLTLTPSMAAKIVMYLDAASSHPLDLEARVREYSQTDDVIAAVTARGGEPALRALVQAGITAITSREAA